MNEQERAVVQEACTSIKHGMPWTHAYKDKVVKSLEQLLEAPVEKSGTPAGELSDAQVRIGMKALLKCATSDLDDYSQPLYDAYEDDVKRVYAVITADKLRANGSTVLVPADKLREMQAAITAKDIELSVRGAQFRYMMKDQAAKFDEIARLTDERDELRKDAERYRWLRSNDIEIPPGQREIYVIQERLPHTEDANVMLVESELDGIIDAAMTKEAA
jgi:hypothetical protein